MDECATGSWQTGMTTRTVLPEAWIPGVLQDELEQRREFEDGLTMAKVVYHSTTVLLLLSPLEGGFRVQSVARAGKGERGWMLELATGREMKKPSVKIFPPVSTEGNFPGNPGRQRWKSSRMIVFLPRK